MSETLGGRIFFSSVRRSLEFEDEIVLVTVGVDIGSSTSHLVFSRLRLERTDNRYIVSERVVLHESEVLLTPYADDQAIDADALRVFIDRQYRLAGVTPEQIDSGALILTGVAVRRRNARAIGELFAAQAGKFVALSAGDALETTLAAFGSGAAALSVRDAVRVMHVDIGGGTSKIAVLEAGAVVEQSALDIGARLLAMDEGGLLRRIEPAGLALAAEVDLELGLGCVPSPAGLQRLVERMADRLWSAAVDRPSSTTSRPPTSPTRSSRCARGRNDARAAGSRPDAISAARSKPTARTALSAPQRLIALWRPSNGLASSANSISPPASAIVASVGWIPPGRPYGSGLGRRCRRAATSALSMFAATTADGRWPNRLILSA